MTRYIGMALVITNVWRRHSVQNVNKNFGMPVKNYKIIFYTLTITIDDEAYLLSSHWPILTPFILSFYLVFRNCLDLLMFKQKFKRITWNLNNTCYYRLIKYHLIYLFYFKNLNIMLRIIKHMRTVYSDASLY